MLQFSNKHCKFPTEIMGAQNSNFAHKFLQMGVFCPIFCIYAQ